GQSGEPRPGLWWPGRRQGGGALASADAGPEKGTDSLRCIPVQPLQQREPSGTDISGLVASSEDQWLRNSGRQQDANDGRDAGKDEGPRGHLLAAALSRGDVCRRLGLEALQQEEKNLRRQSRTAMIHRRESSLCVSSQRSRWRVGR
ncbi:hypothetical protein L209DRAFT_804319, partial [Thermothelomyces heterothallicus CBS 203.75]